VICSAGSPPVPAQQITIAELVNQYLNWADGYYVKNGHPTAEPSDIRCAVRPLLKLYGRTPVREFGPRGLKSVRQEMIETGWARRHINKQVERIKRMIKWAVADETIPPSSYHALQAVAGLKYGRCKAHDNPPVQPAPIELVKAARRHVSRQVAAMIDLQLLTGARPGEIVQLRPCDVDRSDQKVWQYRPREHKTQHHGRDRIIFLGPQAQKVLSPFLLRDPESHCFSPIEAERERYDRLIAERNSPSRRKRRRRRKDLRDHYTRDSYRRAITRSLRKAFPPPGRLAQQPDETGKQHQARLTDEDREAIKVWQREHHWHPHQLRHNYATSVRHEFGLEAAQVLLGHASADVTQIYAERDMGRAASVAAKIG